MTPASDAPFRPRRGRVVPAVAGVAALLIFGVVAVVIPEKFQLVDRLGVLGVGVGIAALMSRYVTIHATPQPDGLLVRNIGGPTLLGWDEIEAVRFSGGMPWVRLDLADGDDHAVMAIQRADGPAAVAEAQRLTDLVAARRRPQARS